MSNSAIGKTYALFDTPLNKKLVAEFEKNVADFFLFPPIETEKIILDKEKKELLRNLKAFDWIIFPDILVVEYFLQILGENEIDFFELDAVRVCAFGEAVADRLRFGQIHADLVPNNLKTNVIFTALTEYIGSENLNGLSFLLVKEDSFDLEIGKLLAAKNAEIIQLPVYRAKVSNKQEITKLKILLKGGAIDEFIFSSPEDLIALKHYFPDEPIIKTFSEIKVLAIDENTFQTLQENNFKPHYFFRNYAVENRID